MPVGRPAIIEPTPLPLADSELVARLFRALADATRLRIVELLLDEPELHQMELVRRLGATQARVSEHMACLLWCGFVESTTEGRRTRYRVTDPTVRKLIADAHEFLDRNEAHIASCRRIDEDKGDG
jgi:DNA-binding transcriptional ArsR family regulator